MIFNKLDKGETWDDDFELNTILQVKLLNPIKYCAYSLGLDMRILLFSSCHRVISSICIITRIFVCKGLAKIL